MTQRRIYQVGSLPLAVIKRGIRSAMEWFIHQVEMGNSKIKEPAEVMAVVCDQDDRWIIRYMDDITERDAFEVIRAGASEGYDDMPIVRPARRLKPRDVSMNRMSEIEAMIKAHRAMGLVGKVPLQLSFPNRLDLALFLFVGRLQIGRFGMPKHFWRTMRGIWYTLRYLRTFKKAQQQEIDDVEEIDTDNVIRWNFETPAVLYALNLVPKFLRRPVAWLLAKQCAGVLKQLPMRDTVLHLCYGNLQRQEVIHPGTMAEPVMFTLALGRQTKDRPIMHYPCAYGSHAAPTNPEYYARLAKLRDTAWRIIAGVVNEHHPKESEEALSAFETALGRPAYGVGPECGLGRRSETEAAAAIHLTARLAGQ